MAFNLDNYNKIEGCANNYNKDNFSTCFFVNEDESKICSACKHFEYRDGIATCNLITGVFESETANDFNSTLME